MARPHIRILSEHTEQYKRTCVSRARAMPIGYFIDKQGKHELEEITLLSLVCSCCAATFLGSYIRFNAAFATAAAVPSSHGRPSSRVARSSSRRTAIVRPGYDKRNKVDSNKWNLERMNSFAHGLIYLCVRNER